MGENTLEIYMNKLTTAWNYEEIHMDININKSNIEDKKISIAIMSSFVVLTIQYLILIYFNLIDTNLGSIVQLISKVLVGFFYLIALPTVFKRNKITFAGIYFIVVFLFLFNYLVFDKNWPYLQTIIFPLFFICLPSFIYAYSIRDWNILMDTMKKASKIVFVIGAIIAILVFMGNSSVGTYSMSLSYYMLLPTIIYMDDFLDKISLKSGLVVAISLIVILALGSRGAILCAGIFVILKALKSFKTITYNKLLIYLIILFIFVIGIIYIYEILEYLYNVLLNFGIRSRSIQLFLRDDIYLSGREKIYDGVINGILDQPILGIGLAGDRQIIGGGYAHNIFIEILANFGVILGSFIILILICLIISSLFTKEDKRYNMIIIWISVGFVHLFVSGSYLIEFKFWILLGLVSQNYKNRKAM